MQSQTHSSHRRHWLKRALVLSALLLPVWAAAQPVAAPKPVEGSWVARDFRFRSGAVMNELRLHYTTLGNPAGEPVLVLHGTTGNGAGMLGPHFGGELFGPGQPLDARLAAPFTADANDVLYQWESSR